MAPVTGTSPTEPSDAAVPPVLDPDCFERHEGFRETTLAWFTDPKANASAREFADLTYTMALEYCTHWPKEPEGSFRHQARAGVADLRHLQGYFAYLGRERDASELAPDEERISRHCSRLALRVKELADGLEQKLDAVGAEAKPR